MFCQLLVLVYTVQLMNIYEYMCCNMAVKSAHVSSVKIMSKYKYGLKILSVIGI